MPIYVYKCESCGYAKDVLQKMSDAPLTDCPTCGAAAFRKQLTSAGFQLKGAGWYATDFKGAAAPTAEGASGALGSEVAAPAAGAAKPAASLPTKPETAPAPVAAASKASAGSGGCGQACACH